MSSRSTPGRNSYPSLPTFNTGGPDPSSSSTRRSIRAPSFTPSFQTPDKHRPSVPDVFHRRDSDRSFVSQHRGSIAPSVVGTSTGTITGGAGRRSRRDRDVGSIGGPGGSQEDWASLEPDEVFKRLPVHEVKRVEAKMRSEALNKQSELRAMVGTRYRDLLTSATQITSLHSSSLRLSDSLREIAKSCTNPTDININVDGDAGSEPSETEDVVNLLPVAAHMKLLLDAPEALYSYLAHHAYLNAAFLWLITRVVKEGLSSMPEESSGPYLPLLQKQWETLLPFRGQIVLRATASLRSKEKLEPRVLSETLLAIVLLDNLPIPDALNLLLSQRTKALRDVLQHTAEASSSKTSLSPNANRKRSNSRIQAANATREAAHEREAIAGVLSDSIHCLLETVVAVQTVFEKRKINTPTGDSLLEEMIRLVQKGEGAPLIQNSTPVKQNSHQRRASRLASISLPLPKLSPSSIRPPVSTPSILQGLPSSQILLRHLPTSITGFTPFITPSPPPAISDKLKAWQSSSIELLKEAIPGWLTGLRNVADIWHVRELLNKLLSGGGDFEKLILNALEGEWSTRVKQVWDERLEGLVRDAEVQIRDAGESVRNDPQESDNIPDSFLFSDITFPSAPAMSFSAASHNSAFTSFLSTLKKRTSYRTPLLDQVLSSLESAAAAIKADMEGLPSALHDGYVSKVKTALDDLVKALEKVLESMGSVRGDGKGGVEAEMFVGRVALYLAKSSSFLVDLTGAEEVDSDGLGKALLAVHAKSTLRWKERAIQEALVLLAPLFEPYRGASEIKATWQGTQPSAPSHPIMVSLQSLVSSTKQLGIPPKVDLPVIEELVREYVGEAKKLEGWKSQTSSEASTQAAVDSGFLVFLEGKEVEKDELVKGFLSKVPSSIPNFEEELPKIIDQSLRRTQLLIYPLTTHLTPSKTTPVQTLGHGHGLDSRNAALLRFGAPVAGKGGAGTEFRSPVPVAKPGKRMGLLSIAA
ncbi:hypothetical protein CI109_100863 [Kwoniella shandongensis]|uniref:Conserved oligomeric Golgi complex subunit 1 n=1 Tax=Kwoniella shandongensis TaxID=1734106 RepID=A0A5M6BU49_9TREE|nr:uncharacterized protein CI109_006115 [Kwoniella shandongensis]KAA5525542.1 hypothetical protein CI109_006115 [Kwoniella shandongensis]